WVWIARKQSRRHLVDSGIGALCRQDYRDQQLKIITVGERALDLAVQCGQIGRYTRRPKKFFLQRLMPLRALFGIRRSGVLTLFSWCGALGRRSCRHRLLAYLVPL